MALASCPNTTNAASHSGAGNSVARLLPCLGMAAIATLVVAAQASAHCESVSAGQSFWVRLLDPVASYSSKPGTTIRAILIQSPECDNNPVFPPGLEVDGEVAAVRRVGLGLVHDSATLEIRFSHLVTAAGQVLPLAADVVEIDNARETARHGVIRGIRATNTPQGRITSGMIHLPTFNPYSDFGLIVYRALTILPEPEIYLPPGTDLRLELNIPLVIGEQPEIPRPSLALDEYERGDVEQIMEKSSDRTTTRSGEDADLVNLLFVGGQEQIDQAFSAAGWIPAERNSPKAFFKQLVAFLNSSNYSNMPITHQLLNGQPQDLTWQKSFNSYGKREHIRIWSEAGTVDGQPAWLSAYTRETSASFSVRYHKFIHRIDRNVDDGVDMMVRDLSLTGCVAAVRQLPRPHMPQLMTNSTGDELRTDGNLTIVHLKSCNRPMLQSSRTTPLIPMRPHSRLARYFRTQVLLYKSDVTRGNIIYSAYDVGRLTVHALRRRRRAEPAEVDPGLPLYAVSPDTLFHQITLGGD